MELESHQFENIESKLPVGVQKYVDTFLRKYNLGNESHKWQKRAMDLYAEELLNVNTDRSEQIDEDRVETINNRVAIKLRLEMETHKLAKSDESTLFSPEFESRIKTIISEVYPVDEQFQKEVLKKAEDIYAQEIKTNPFKEMPLATQQHIENQIAQLIQNGKLKHGI